MCLVWELLCPSACSPFISLPSSPPGGTCEASPCVPLAAAHPAGTFPTPCAGPGTAVPRVPRLPGGLSSVPVPLVPSTPKSPFPNGPGPATAAPAASVRCQLSPHWGHAGSNRMEPGVASPCSASPALAQGRGPSPCWAVCRGVAVLELPRGCPLDGCWGTGL